SASPKHDVLPKFRLELSRVHAGAGDLNGIDDFQPGIDEVGQQLSHSTAAVQHHLDVGKLLGPPPHRLVPRFEEFAIHMGRDLRPALHSQVVAKADNIDA